MPQICEVFHTAFGDDPYKNMDATPEIEALDFYLSNHVVALVRTKYGMDKELGRTENRLVEMYVQRTNEIALRAFAYLLLICTREIRYCQSSDHIECGITTEEGPVYEFIRNNISPFNGGKLARNIWTGEYKFELGLWTAVLEKVFQHGFYQPGFGGPKWAAVASTLREYVQGTYTAEMMTDVMWTLSHNYGPIFNKSMLYKCHTDELLRVLDVQRAGQVPNFDWESHLAVSPWFTNYLVLACGVFPELSKDADILAIKTTALHPVFWQGEKYQTKGHKLIKPSVGSQPEITTKKVEIDRG